MKYEPKAKTTNAYGHIISGSQVRISNSSKVFDVGEIDDHYATLYGENSKCYGTFPITELVRV